MANRYKMQVLRAVDGDTVEAHLIAEELGIILPHQKFRFFGCNTPEKKMPNYYEAKEFTAQHTEGNTLEIDLHGKDAFGRWLVDVHIEGEAKLLNQMLIDEGLAVVFKH